MNFADNPLLKKLRDEWRARLESIAAEQRRQNWSRGQQARRARERAARKNSRACSTVYFS
jgi:hypothetical protein